MPTPASEEKTDNVIHLSFAARPVPAQPPPSPPFLLEARPDGWKLHHGDRVLNAEDLAATADLLRDIARTLAEMAQGAAGQPVRRCMAEFVLYETGGIDHWIAETADRTRLRQGLRTAISTIRET